MSNFDFAIDSKLSQAAYQSNNMPNSTIINGWTSLQITLQNYNPSESFGAQLYVKDGQYKLAFRGTNGGLADWAQNLKYGTFQWSKEFEDAVVFMANAIKFIAREDGVSLEMAAQRLSTTGHSQGGFEAELVSKLFGVKGTSFDGMGAAGVAEQFRVKFTEIMHREGVGTLAVNHVLTETDFLTRKYTAVGNIGIHAGETEGAWSWSLSKILILLNPSTAGAVLTGGLLVHSIDDIVANEQLRAKNPIWKSIGDAGSFDNPTQLANALSGQWGSIQTVWAGGGLTSVPDTTKVNAQIKSFLQDHTGESIQYWQDDKNKTLSIELSNGDALLIYQDGRVLKTQTLGVAVVQTMYGKNGDVAMRSSMQVDDDGNALVTRSGVGFSSTYVVDPTGQLVRGNNKQLDANQKVMTESVYERNADNTLTTWVYDGSHQLISQTITQNFDDGSQTEIKTENGHTYMRATVPSEDGRDVEVSEWRDLETHQTLTQQHFQNMLYTDMAGFINALRAGDKLGQTLYGSKMALDVLISQGSTATQALAGMHNTLSGISGVVGVVASLHALQSEDTLTQAGAAVGLLGSANQIAQAINTAQAGGKAANGFLSGPELAALQTVSSLLALANLRNLGDMLNNGQVGSAGATVYQAIEAVEFLAAAAETSAVEASAATAPDPVTMLIILVTALVLDDIFSNDAPAPPPKPPVGWADFTRGADGQLAWTYHDTLPDGRSYGYADTAMGKRLLDAKLQELVSTLNQQVIDANKANPRLSTDPDRALVLVASRLPRVHLQSWVSYGGNGVDNYHYLLESRDAQTGEAHYQPIARQDIGKYFSASVLAPEALVQQWQVNHMSAKFGADESKWLTEGQYLQHESSIEEQRSALKLSLFNAQKAMDKAKSLTIDMRTNDDLTQQEYAQLQASQAAKEQAIAEAQNELNRIEASTKRFNAQHPQQGQLAAAVVDENSTLWENAEALTMARAHATQQWLKVIALDWDGNGSIAKIVPKANLSTDLRSMQSDGAARFDVDNDGYREVTEWVGNTDAVLGLDRDGNGLLDTASELFDAPSTTFDQRGIHSLKYYDSNNDGKITAADKAWKLLRVWMDVNGDGSAGALETLTMDMNYVGVDMEALKASLDAVGKTALQTLQGLRVMSIDLATQTMHLANGTSVNMVDQSLKADVLGTMLQYDAATQNVTVLKERKGEDAERENYITALQDLSVLQELKRTDISNERRQALLAIAMKYGLDPKANDFNTVLDSLVAGIDTVLKPDPTKISTDDVAVGMSRMILNTLAPMDTLWAQSSSTSGFTENWTTARSVNANEVKSDVAAITPSVAKEPQWVLPSNIYTLDHVTKGAQQGGLVAQQAVVVSQKTDHTAVPAQTVQVYTTATPSLTLSGARYQSKEDEGLNFGYLQLTQEARSALTDGTASTLKLLGVREVRHGAVAMDDANSLMRFTPEANYTGNDAGFVYVVADATGRIMQRRVDVALAEVNDAPTVLGETVATVEDVPLLFNAAMLLSNDSDPEGDAFKIIGLGRVNMGKATLEENGQIRYVPPQDMYGVTDTLEYLVQDARGAVSIGKVKIKLAAVADAPTVLGELIRNAHEDETLYIQAKLLLANDFDPDVDARVGGEPLRITAVSGATHGQVFLSAQGDVIFVPEQNFHGTASFNYIVADADGLITPAKADIAITASNDGPQTFGETIQGLEDEVLTIDPDLLLSNDLDADATLDKQKLRIHSVGETDQYAPVGGRVALVNGKIVFTPTTNRYGDARFTYFVEDGAGGVSASTVNIKLTSVNDAPNVPQRTFVAQEDTLLKIKASQLMVNVSDVEDAVGNLTLSVDLNSVRRGVLLKAYDATVGEDVYTFTPNSNFNTAKNGMAGFSYSVTDRDGAKSTATVNLNVNSVNDAPVFLSGSNITRSGTEDTPMRLSEAALIKMFEDADGDALSLNISSLRALNAGDSIRYDAATQEVVFTPAANANGLRQIAFAVKDTSGASSELVTLNLNLAPVNDAPVVGAFGFQVLEDAGSINSSTSGLNTIYLRDILAKASDADGDELGIMAVKNFSLPGNIYMAYSNAKGTLTFSTPLNYYGQFNFDFTVTDGRGGLTTQTAYGVITPVNDAPDVSVVRLNPEKGDLALNYKLTVTDVDSPSYQIVVDKNPLQSTLYMGRNWDSYTVGLIATKRLGAPLSSDYFCVDNWINRGRTQDESATFKITDNSGLSAYRQVFFKAIGYDPIIIDLNSDGLSFINARDSQARFDVDGDGVKDQIAWVGREDAMLVYDHNNDGQVTRFDELAFGAHLNNPNPNLPDLQALARPEFDTNQDGVFNASDAKWGTFKLWQDKNSNGVVDAGEMQSLSSAGVSALYLHANVLNHAYGPDVSIRGYTRVQMSDGRMLQAGDAQFGLYDPSLDASPAPDANAGIAKEATLAQVKAQIEQIELSLDAQLHAGDTHFTGALQNVQHQKALVGKAYDYVLPSGENYEVSLADGRPLPSWLSYNASTHTLSGTPTDLSAGTWMIRVKTQGSQTFSALLNLEVTQYNQAPMVYGDMPTQFAAENQAFRLDVAPNFFIDRDATDALVFSAQQANGEPLPEWLHFDAKNLRFEGTPGQADVGNMNIVLAAHDAANASAEVHFDVVVSNLNEAPTVAHGLAPFGVRVGQVNRYEVPSITFSDADVGVDASEHLTYTAAMADGSPLPAWLSFASDSRVLSATPTAQEVMLPTQLRITATDAQGMGVSTFLAVGLGQWGTAGDDSLQGSAASEYVWGAAGNDTLNGDAGADVLMGGVGDDVYVVDAFDTVVENTNEGTDAIHTSISYVLDVNVENLTLTGSAAISGTGNDLSNQINGNNADNVLDGGAGNDSLWGGEGADTFMFTTTLDSQSNVDTLIDFSPAQGDQIALDKFIFTRLAGKTNLTNHFRLSTQAAQGGDDYIVYNVATGQISYDATGSASDAAVVFAVLQNKPQTLTPQSFVVM